MIPIVHLSVQDLAPRDGNSFQQMNYKLIALFWANTKQTHAKALELSHTVSELSA